MRKRLTAAEVRRLATEPSIDRRTEAAALVTSTYDRSLTAAEQRLAEEIFRALLEDAEVRVRAGLSEALKANPDIPHDIAMALACDVEAVATPVLSFSPALLDEDLIAIVKTRSQAHRLAVAGRARVPSQVCQALIETGEREVVTRLVGNEGADLQEEQLAAVLDGFADDPNVTSPMVRRRALPMAIAERLVTVVSEHLREHLVTHHRLPEDLTAQLVLESRERAVVGLLDGQPERGDVLELVDRLAKNGRLTISLSLRALCAGDLVFFEAALARLAGVPVVSAFRLLHDGGPVGLKALISQAGFSENGYRLARAALEVAGELRGVVGHIDRARLAERTAAVILTKFGDALSDAESRFMLGLLGARPPQGLRPTLH
ncbi:MAG: DUF2336 domain-containing protein [Alphaproteobacteria bacterium]|nr:DUF2336 domain-containing protein [Alphaproteobacteria bacterium]